MTDAERWAARVYWTLRASTADEAEFERLLGRILAVAGYYAEPEAQEILDYAYANGLEAEMHKAVHDHLEAGGDVREAFRTWYAAAKGGLRGAGRL